MLFFPSQISFILVISSYSVFRLILFGFFILRIRKLKSLFTGFADTSFHTFSFWYALSFRVVVLPFWEARNRWLPSSHLFIKITVSSYSIAFWVFSDVFEDSILIAISMLYYCSFKILESYSITCHRFYCSSYRRLQQQHVKFIESNFSSICLYIVFFSSYCLLCWIF